MGAKINYLAEHTDYELYMILTEKAGQKWYYTINPKVHWINFDINFDELDTMPLLKKLFFYQQKQRRYKKMFTDYLMKVRPDITVSTVRREINLSMIFQMAVKKLVRYTLIDLIIEIYTFLFYLFLLTIIFHENG
jgi:hypothetical protein